MVCYVCGNDAGKTELGFSRLRHDTCAPGSSRWATWYKAHPEKHTEAGDILLRHSETTRTKKRASLEAFLSKRKAQIEAGEIVPTRRRRKSPIRRATKTT